MRSTPPDPGDQAGRLGPAGGQAAGPPARAGLPQSSRILIVEDEPALLRALQINLRARGYDVATARAGRKALTEAVRRPPDAILLDLGLPDLDGTEVIREFRSWSAAPVIVLSGRASSSDKIGALDAGADDYVTKPFNMEELLARLRAALRRDEGAGPIAAVILGRWTIDRAARTVTRRDDQAGPAPAGRAAPAGPAAPAQTPHLTPTEWRLLEVLLQHPGQLVSASRLVAKLWGPQPERSTHYLRFHMASLRRKLEDDPARPRHLLTEPGMGYRYQR